MALSVAPTPIPSSTMICDIDPEKEPEKTEEGRRAWAARLSKLWRRQEPKSMPGQWQQDTPPPTPTRPGLGRRLSRKVGVGIPRSTTFKRQEEEQRQNLEPVQPTIKERRGVSQIRQRALSAQPIPPRAAKRKQSVPEGEDLRNAYSSIQGRMLEPFDLKVATAPRDLIPPPPPPPPLPPNADLHQHENLSTTEASYDDAIDEEIRQELGKKWILNLSMQFRDKSPREKFFLTYADNPQRWRRVTISCDYRDAPLDSLEADLEKLSSQRDKSSRIYESIRMSLPDIQFYGTVTNLKLETRDDRLHVHVTEDVNEIIPYPSLRSVRHLSCRFYKESEVNFVEHMSGFVYKVNLGEHTWVKKEIPGPDSVNEFLYEVNALSELVGSRHVIELKGLVIDEDGSFLKGLLIGYAEKRALVDIIYDNEGQIPWPRREKWARQIVQGLSEIHEAGFVQGDFTLSNIVIDGSDDVKIIDINRRGCPIGWEPPELARLVENGQRISMFIGVKSDLFQLGMVLYALAHQDDEPERRERPLTDVIGANDEPQFYHRLTNICLDENPKKRLAAKDLLPLFPHHLNDSRFTWLSDADSQDMAPFSSGAVSSTPVRQKGYKGLPQHEDFRTNDPVQNRQERGTTEDSGVGMAVRDSNNPIHRSLDDKKIESVPDRSSIVQSEWRELANHASFGSLLPKMDSIVTSASLPGERKRLRISGGQATPPLAKLPTLNTGPRYNGQNADAANVNMDTSFCPPKRLENSLDGLGAQFIPTRGRQLSNDTHELLTANMDNIAPNHSETGEPQIVPVSPTGDHRWEQIMMDGTPYLVSRDTLDSPNDEDLTQPHTKNMTNDLGLDFEHRDSGLADTLDDKRTMKSLTEVEAGDMSRQFKHVDSGVADMDLGAVGSRHKTLMDLAGVDSGIGVSEEWSVDQQKYNAEEKKGIVEETKGSIEIAAAQGTTDDLSIAHNDRHGDTDL